MSNGVLPSAVASQRALENNLEEEEKEEAQPQEPRQRTDSENSLVGDRHAAIAIALEPLGIRKDSTAEAPASPAEVWDREAAELHEGDILGRDKEGVLHHVNESPSDPQDATNKVTEDGLGPSKSRSEEILIRTIQANKPLIAIPGVPEARDREGRPLPTPSLPSSMRGCIEGKHMQAEVPEVEQNEPLNKLSRNEYIFLGAIGGLTVAGWIVGSLGLSLIWLLLISGAGALAIYKARLKQEKQLDWEHHHVEGALTLGANVETAEWLNFFLAQIWHILNPDIFVALTDQIEDQANLLATDLLKGLVFNISVRDFELGPHVPRVTSIQTYPVASGEDSVLMDLTISMEAPAQLTSSDNSKLGMHMTVTMDVGAEKFASMTIPTLVEVSQMEMKMRVQLTLSSVPPFVKEARMSFLSEPVVGISIKPLKLVNIMNLPVLDTFILTSITSALNELALAPRVLRIDLESLLTGQEISTDTKALGVVKVVVHETVGTRKADAWSESDEYVMISLESTSRPVARTRVVSDDPRPRWEDTHWLLVSEDHVRADSRVTLTVWDWDAEKPDEFIGKIQLPVRDLIDNQGPLFRGWKRLTTEDPDEMAEGWLHCEIGFFPKTEREQPPIMNTEFAGEEQKKVEKRPGKEFNAGVLGILVHQGAELAVRKKDAFRDYVSAYARIYVNDIPTFKTRTKAHNPAPFWNVQLERFCPDYRDAVVRIVVKDERPREWDPVIGVVLVKIGDLLDLSEGRRTDTRWWNLDGGIGFGKLRISFVFRSVDMVEPANLTTYDVGTLVFGHFQARNLNKFTSSVPSPYLDFRMSLSADTEWTRKTAPVVKKTHNPDWPEEAIVPFRTLHRSQAVVQISVRDHSSGVLRAKEIATANFFTQDVGEKAEWFEVELLPSRSKDDISKDLRRHGPAKMPCVQDVGGNAGKNQGETREGIDRSQAEARGKKKDDKGQELPDPRTLQRAHQHLAQNDGPLQPLTTADPGPTQVGADQVPPQIAKLKENPDPVIRRLAGPEEASKDKPVLLLKATFRPGLSWVESLREGEEHEIAELRGGKKGKGKEVKPRKWFGSGGSTIRSGEPARSARDDKKLPGNGFTRTLAWSLGLGGMAASKVSSSLWVARKERHLPDLPVENE